NHSVFTLEERRTFKSMVSKAQAKQITIDKQGSSQETMSAQHGVDSEHVDVEGGRQSWWWRMTRRNKQCRGDVHHQFTLGGIEPGTTNLPREWRHLRWRSCHDSMGWRAWWGPHIHPHFDALLGRRDGTKRIVWESIFRLDCNDGLSVGVESEPSLDP